MFGLLSFDSIFADNKVAIFAGGCFWCMQSDFDKLAGVNKTVVGYDGGTRKNPNYQLVSSGQTDYVESLKIFYNPKKISYKKLLICFWKNIDPTVANAQFCDHGKQYRSVIFYLNNNQKAIALESLDTIRHCFKNVYTQILPSTHFYLAEKYHQDYYKKNPVRYKFYRWNCGRDKRLQKVWHSINLNANRLTTQSAKNEPTWINFDKAARLKKLTKLQYEVTQKNATERSFHNAYWNNNKKGIYVNIVSGEPLFSSTDKYKSGTGWPSFTKPISPNFIVNKTDRSWFTTRTEVLSRYADSHLGHVFNDGPKPTGKRYCLNSAALHFIPVNKMKAEGYGKYLYLFNKK